MYVFQDTLSIVSIIDYDSDMDTVWYDLFYSVAGSCIPRRGVN